MRIGEMTGAPIPDEGSAAVNVVASGLLALAVFDNRDEGAGLDIDGKDGDPDIGV